MTRPSPSGSLNIIPPWVIPSHGDCHAIHGSCQGHSYGAKTIIVILTGLIPGESDPYISPPIYGRSVVWDLVTATASNPGQRNILFQNHV
jgi:hypothetical protein